MLTDADGNALKTTYVCVPAGVQTAVQTDVLYGYTSTIRSHVVISALVKLNDIITLAFINIVIALQQDFSDKCMRCTTPPASPYYDLKDLWSSYVQYQGIINQHLFPNYVR
uniref:Uncharacterized protein n=1 Tax=Glossina pallidipes TaxID=7398 RepID=A0A1B0GGM6_GLOPL